MNNKQVAIDSVASTLGILIILAFIIAVVQTGTAGIFRYGCTTCSGNGRHHRKPYKDQRLHFRRPMRLPGRSRKRMLHGRSSIGRAVSYGYGSDRICCRSCHGTSSRADLRPHKRSCPDPLHRKECRGCHACNQCSEPGKFSYPYPQDFL